MIGESVTLGQAVVVCIFCMIMVFAVLILLSYLIDVSAWFIASITGRKKRLEREKQNSSSGKR